MHIRLVNTHSKQALIAEYALSFMSRLRGLMGREEHEIHGGLFLQNCSSVHCCFMKVPLRIVYLRSDCAGASHPDCARSNSYAKAYAGSEAYAGSAANRTCLEVLFCETVMPWRLGSHVPKAKHVLELPVHTDFDVRPGDQLLIEATDLRPTYNRTDRLVIDL